MRMRIGVKKKIRKDVKKAKSVREHSHAEGRVRGKTETKTTISLGEGKRMGVLTAAYMSM